MANIFEKYVNTIIIEGMYCGPVGIGDRQWMNRGSWLPHGKMPFLGEEAEIKQISLGRAKLTKENEEKG